MGLNNAALVLPCNVGKSSAITVVLSVEPQRIQHMSFDVLLKKLLPHGLQA
jgi:hypothetical protein